MQLCGYQPHYFPRLHYMNRVLESEIFEISDYVQFVKKHAFPTSDGIMKRGKSFQAHTVIKNPQGAFFLAVPTQGEMLPINKTPIDYSKNWSKDHLKTIEVNYRKSLNFEIFFPELENLLTKEYKSIGDLTMQTVYWGIARFITYDKLPFDEYTLENISALVQQQKAFRLQKIFIASKSPVPAPEKGKTNEWCIDLCKYAGADEYIFGATSHNAYMDLEKFKQAGIKPILQDWKCDEYRQQFPKTQFLPNLSYLDLVMNVPHNEAVRIIKGK